MSDLLKRRGLALLILATAGFAAVACLPALEPEPEPTPAVLQLSLSPSLNTLRPLLKRCAEEQPGLGLVVYESLAPDLERAGLAIRWGADNLPGGYAAMLGEETLAVIVHPQNPLSEAPLADLRDMYAGTRQEWPGGSPGGEIQPMAYPAGLDIQEVFAALVAGRSLPANITYLVPDPAAMIEAVASSPTAIGFIPQRWLDERVKPVRITGLEADRLRQPILSLSKSEPVGPEKPWLLCLQAGLAE